MDNIPGAMRSHLVIFFSPPLDWHSGFGEGTEYPLLRNSSLSFPLNDSTYPFSQGLPGSMNMAFTPRFDNHPLTALEVNSGPLSERMCSGIPLTRNSI